MHAIGAVISIVLLLIIIGAVWYAVTMIINALPIAEPFRTIIYAIGILVAVLIGVWIIVLILQAFGVPVHMLDIR